MIADALWTVSSSNAPLVPVDWLIPPTWIAGTPRPQGSKRAIVREGQKHPSMVESSKYVASWRADIRSEVAKAWGRPPLDCALEVAVVLCFRRPLSHFVAGRRDRPLRPDAPVYHAQDPDLSKLLRALEDALTSVTWADDNLIARFHDPVKLWALEAGMWITFRALP